MSTIINETKQWLEEYYTKPENWSRLMIKKILLDQAVQLKIEREALGSGVIVTRRGLIVTNDHVIEKADKIKVEYIERSDAFLFPTVGIR